MGVPIVRENCLHNVRVTGHDSSTLRRTLEVSFKISVKNASVEHQLIHAFNLGKVLTDFSNGFCMKLKEITGLHLKEAHFASLVRCSDAQHHTAEQPTAFFESMFALINRAVQHILKSDIEALVRSGDEGIAGRIELEISRLFKSQDFGRPLGAKEARRAFGPHAEVKTLCVKAEEEVARLMRKLAERRTEDAKKVEELSTKLPDQAEREVLKHRFVFESCKNVSDCRKHMPESPKNIPDNSHKIGRDGDRRLFQPGGNRREAQSSSSSRTEEALIVEDITNPLIIAERLDVELPSKMIMGEEVEKGIKCQDAPGHASNGTSVEAFIARFRAGEPARLRRRSAHRRDGPQYVGRARSPMIQSILPSPHDQTVHVDSWCQARLRRNTFTPSKSGVSEERPLSSASMATTPTPHRRQRPKSCTAPFRNCLMGVGDCHGPS